jgi:hypothetical protein
MSRRPVCQSTCRLLCWRFMSGYTAWWCAPRPTGGILLDSTWRPSPSSGFRSGAGSSGCAQSKRRIPVAWPGRVGFPGYPRPFPRVWVAVSGSRCPGSLVADWGCRLPPDTATPSGQTPCSALVEPARACPPLLERRTRTQLLTTRPQPPAHSTGPPCPREAGRVRPWPRGGCVGGALHPWAAVGRCAAWRRSFVTNTPLAARAGPRLAAGCRAASRTPPESRSFLVAECPIRPRIAVFVGMSPRIRPPPAPRSPALSGRP